MKILKTLLVVATSLALISCAEYKPPTPELINFMVKIWNMFFAVGYIVIVTGLALKRASLLGFGFIFLSSTYCAFYLFDIVNRGYNLTLGLPF